MKLLELKEVMSRGDSKRLILLNIVHTRNLQFLTILHNLVANI